MAILRPDGKPFAQVDPSPEIREMREGLMQALKTVNPGRYGKPEDYNPHYPIKQKGIIAALSELGHPINRYDAAQTTSQNEQHWKWADLLSPDAANILTVRARLRSRSRYEESNNGYLKGITLTLAKDFVGSGPSLQITDPAFTEQERNIIEQRWKSRSKRINERRKLWQSRMNKCRDGEGFLFYFNNRKCQHAVKVDQKVVECDQVTHYYQSAGTMTLAGRNEVDGIRIDPISGEPTRYHLLNQHPGEYHFFDLFPFQGKWVRAEFVSHWFRRDRQWHRGIPETTPTLPLWALIRRYTLAVVQNAEIAADFTVLLKSLQPVGTVPFQGSVGQGAANTEDWFSSFPIDRGLMTVLPDMYDMGQLDPKQPVNTYDNFVNALVQEAARPLMMPRNLALGNSGDYNMSASSFDAMLYQGALNEERYSCEEDILSKNFNLWWQEAILTEGYFDGYESAEDPTSQPVQLKLHQQIVAKAKQEEYSPEHCFRWDQAPQHVDPVKVAQAMNILFTGGHISDTDIQEKHFNRSADEHYANLRKQNENREELGLSSATPAAPDPMELAQVKFDNQGSDDDDPPSKKSNGSNGNGKNRISALFPSENGKH